MPIDPIVLRYATHLNVRTRTQPLDCTGELIEGGVGALEQAVDDINDRAPVAVEIVGGVEGGRTYSLRTRSRSAQKTRRKPQKTRILPVERGG